MNPRIEFDTEDPRLTAYALGELEEKDRLEIETLLATNPEAKRFVDEIRATARQLESEFAAEPVTQLAPEQRSDVLRAASRKPTPWYRSTALTALAASVLVFVTAAWMSMNTEQAAVGGWAASPREERPRSVPIASMSPGLPKRVVSERESPMMRVLRESAYVSGEAELVEVSKPELGYLSQDLNTESYAVVPENPFVRVATDPRSTFSIDVDTASYSNARRFLMNGTLPPPNAIRVEEFINYFPYTYPEPDAGLPFSVTTEVARCPWQPAHKLVLVGLRGKSVKFEARKPTNLVFLIDVSGSMNAPDKLPLLVSSMKLLVEQMGRNDRVAIVVYAGSSGLVLPSTTGDEQNVVMEALERLQAGGSTNGGAGIELAYRVAQEHFLRDGVNRVILATDGDFNVGVTNQGDLVQLIEEKRKSGVFLSVLGFGTGNLKDSTMEQLADKGNGNYAYIDSLAEGRKVLVEQMGGTLEVIAKDVKIQVEFNPAEATAFRLIGYENRILAHQDFNDDTKDAGEIGAGIAVTALYEVVPNGVPFSGPDVDPSRYQPEPDAKVNFRDELMFLRLRYKEPNGEVSKLIEAPVKTSDVEFRAASENLRFATSVASFAMLLRQGKPLGDFTLDTCLAFTQEAIGADPGGYRRELLALMRLAKQAWANLPKTESPASQGK